MKRYKVRLLHNCGVPDCAGAAGSIVVIDEARWNRWRDQRGTARLIEVLDEPASPPEKRGPGRPRKAEPDVRTEPNG